LLFLNGKTFLTPMRLIQFLALAAAFSAVYPLIVRFAAPLTEFLSKLGRNSLNVFCVGSLLSLTAQIIRYVYAGALVVDTMIVVVGTALLWFTAWISERKASQGAKEAS
ncbi:MAG: OpgC domain-containing protein, partial [Hyphomicrobiaceae bacterium]